MINVRKTKRIAKFGVLEPRRCEDVKGTVAPEIDPKSLGTFEKQGPVCDLPSSVFGLYFLGWVLGYWFLPL